jgi:hypothetical protein
MIQAKCDSATARSQYPLSYRQVQMMSGHNDPKIVMRYDHGRENLDQKFAKGDCRIYSAGEFRTVREPRPFLKFP